MDRLYRPTHTPPSWWERLLIQWALVIYMIGWVDRAAAGYITTLHYAAHNAPWPILITRTLSSTGLLLAATLVIVATVLPVPEQDGKRLRQVWAIYQAGFSAGTLVWAGILSRNIVAGATRSFWTTTLVALLISVVGWGVIRVTSRTARLAAQRLTEAAREAARS